MNGKYFAGFNLDDVYRQEEQRKAQQNKEDAQPPRSKHKTKNTGAVEPQNGTVIATSYNDIEFEPRAYRMKGEDDKALFTYGQSLARLQKKGFERHPRSQEAFGLIIDGLEGRLSSDFKAIYDDLVEGYGEWFSLAFERKGNLLIAYVDPKSLTWEEGCRKDSQFGYTSKHDFDITGKKSQEWTSLNKFDDNFVQFLYGKSFRELPEEMREGSSRINNAQVSLPKDGETLPAGRGDFYGRFYIFGYDCTCRASRRVRSAQKNSSGNRGSP